LNSIFKRSALWRRPPLFALRASRSAWRNPIYEIGQAQCLGDRFASGKGLQDILQVNPNMLFQTDEFDSLLQTINKAKDNRQEYLMSTLLSMFSTSNSIFAMRPKAGKTAPGIIDQPCLTIFGTAIPTWYYDALSLRMLTNGLFARLITLECGRRAAGQKSGMIILSERILERAHYWADLKLGTGNLENWHPIPAVVGTSLPAQQLLAETRELTEVEYERAEAHQDAIGTTVWGRVHEYACKLALLYAISENHKNPQIGVNAVKWATALVLHQTRRRLFMAQGHVSENAFDADCLKFKQKLREAPERTLSHSVLLKRMKLDAQMFQKLVSTLQQQRDIEIQQIKTTGRTGVAYRLIEA